MGRGESSSTSSSSRDEMHTRILTTSSPCHPLPQDNFDFHSTQAFIVRPSTEPEDGNAKSSLFNVDALQEIEDFTQWYV